MAKTKETHAMGFIPLILAVVIGATVITPMVGWMLSLNASISNIDGKLEAMSVATTEWNRLNSMSMEDLESQASALSDYKVGDYQVLVDIGNKGHMADGSCKTSGLGADDKLNCYKDSKITIRKDNQTLYTSRLMPLSVSQGSGVQTSYGFTQDGGWYELPDGFIIQWGKTGNTTGFGQNNSVTFPKPYKTDCYFVTYARTTPTANAYNWTEEDYSTSWNILTIGSKSKKGFTFAGYLNNPVIWYAFGK